MKKILYAFFFLPLAFGLQGQVTGDFETIIEGEKAAWLRKQGAQERGSLSSANNKSDITYTRFHFWVDPAVRYIRGEIMTVFEPSELLQSLDFDFSTALVMDSILWHGQKLNFTRNADILTVQFPTSLLLTDSLTFYYQGQPTSTGFGSFETNVHGNGKPVMWTLSEPYGAMEWMPCKQALSDKLDSVDILITHPAAYRAASNGILISEFSNNGQTTAHWKHRYPIATYLVAIAVTDYHVFTEEVSHALGNTPIVNYVYPESVADAQGSMSYLAEQMQLYNDLFGLYPFQKEKYGHAQFGWGGGMEHQTMSFMGGFGFELVAHEMAHQWFGDKITCGSWEDIWLNEGFATYLSGLCYERIATQYWQQFKQQRISNVTSQPGGSLRVDDTTSVNRIFSGRLTYAKGAMVLHQLRWILGDQAFFDGIRAYLNDPMLSFGYARTENLKYHLETVSGKNLDGFFADWYSGQGYPSYQITWAQDSQKKLYFTVTQSQSHSSVPYFELPLPIRLRGAQGEVQDIALNHTTNGQQFQELGNFVVTSVEFDPELWLITKNNTVQKLAVATHQLTDLGYSLRVEPNPVQSQLIHITIIAPIATEAEFLLESLDGVLITSAMEQMTSGETRLVLPLNNLPVGVYNLRVRSKEGEMSTRVMVQ